MAFNSAHWTINYTAKTVTNNDSGTGSNVPAVTGNQTFVGTCLDFFQWLATEAASSAQMDDTYPIVSDTPTVYKWINGWAFGHADDTKYLTGGDFTSSDGLEQWNSVFTIGSLTAGTQISVFQNDLEITPWWDTDNIDILVKVKTAGTFIQSDDVSGTPKNGGIWLYTRKLGDFYNHGFVDLENGRAPIGLDTAIDTDNETLEATIQGWYDSVGFTITFGTVSRDLNNGSGSVNYDVEINCDGRPMTEVYEVLKLATQYGETTSDLNGDDGQEYRSAGEGSYAEIKTAPFGTIAGGTVYGARGIWFTNYSAADFVLIDAAGATQEPPNYQKVNANHPSLSGTNILVAESSAGAVIKNQYTIASVTTTTITCDGTPTLDSSKTPLTGTVKVGDTKYAYTSFSGNVLSGVTPDPTGETGDFYIPLLDVTADAVAELSDNIVYGGDITVVTSVRKYGFKPYDVETSFGITGLTFTPILSTDPQAT